MIPGAGPTKAHRRGRSSFRACACQTPGESARGPAGPLALIRFRRRVRRKRGNFFAGELAPRRGNCLLAVSAPGNAQHFSGNCVGVAVAGEILPPPPRNRRPSRVNSFPPACTAETQQFLRRGACPPEKKLLPFRSERPGGRPAARPVSECIFAQVTSSLGRNVVAGELAPPSKICPSHPQMLHTLYGALW